MKKVVLGLGFLVLGGLVALATIHWQLALAAFVATVVASFTSHKGFRILLHEFSAVLAVWGYIAFPHLRPAGLIIGSILATITVLGFCYLMVNGDQEQEA